MSAWPEAIYIINKLNKALENTTTFEQDITLIKNANREIDNLYTKVVTGGITEETVAEFNAAHNITTYDEIQVQVAEGYLDREVKYSQMSQQTPAIKTATVLVPSTVFYLDDQNNLVLDPQHDFSYILTDDDTNNQVVHIYTNYIRQDNFNANPPELNENDDYSVQSIIRYLYAQDVFLDTMIADLNARLEYFIEFNHFTDLQELVTQTNSKMILIQNENDPPVSSNVLPIGDFTVWLGTRVG